MDELRLRGWLMQAPKPGRLVAVTTDGETQEVALGGTNRRTWLSVAKTILALEPAPRSIQAFDAEGKLLRAAALDGTEDKATAGAASALALPLGTDPETVRLVTFGQLLASAHQFATGLAFEKMVELFELQARSYETLAGRLERVETQYRKTLHDQIEDAFDEARQMQEQGQQQTGNPLLDMAAQFVTNMQLGAAAAQARQAPPAAPNGKGKAPE